MPIALIVLRTMLGFTPPEWAYVTTQRTDVVLAVRLYVRLEGVTAPGKAVASATHVHLPFLGRERSPSTMFFKRASGFAISCH